MASWAAAALAGSAAFTAGLAPAGGTTLARVGLGAASSHLEVTCVVRASPGAVWQAWTTPGGLVSFWARDATVDARAGGRFDLVLHGGAGSGPVRADVLAVDPHRRLALAWPTRPAADDDSPRTLLEVWIGPAERGFTAVTLRQTGFGDGPAADRTRETFRGTWARVLQSLKRTLEPRDAPGTSGDRCGSESANGLAPVML